MRFRNYLAEQYKKEDEIDHSVGVIILKKIGDFVKKGDVIAKVHYNSADFINLSLDLIFGAVKISGNKAEKREVIVGIRN